MFPYRFRKSWMTGAVALAAGLLIGSSAIAAVNLKKVQVDGSQVDLLFDGKVAAGQIQTEFFKDIVQISINDASVYPAKITSVSGMDLTKVFAYQYAPKLVRCRLSVKGKAEDYQRRVQVVPKGKIITVRISGGGASDEVAHSMAQATREDEKVADHSPAGRRGQGEQAANEMSSEEKALLERVMKNEKPQPVQAAAPAANTASKREKGEKGKDDSEDLPIKASEKKLAGGKALPSPLRSIGMLILVTGMFVGGALLFKKFKGGKLGALSNHKGFSGILGKFGKQKMIEVVATHYLGPKKSIAVVKIGGRQLVLGVTNESINLIASMPEQGEANVDDLALDSLGDSDPVLDIGLGFSKTASGKSAFADVLGAAANPQSAVPQTARSGVRAQIRNKIEWMKRI